MSYLILHRDLSGAIGPGGRQYDSHVPLEIPNEADPWYLAALAPIAAAGCQGAFLGHFAVLAVTVGIFVGTLTLGRSAQARTTTSPIDKTV